VATIPTETLKIIGPGRKLPSNGLPSTTSKVVHRPKITRRLTAQTRRSSYGELSASVVVATFFTPEDVPELVDSDYTGEINVLTSSNGNMR
jgi:hypothetical protein